MVSNFIVQVLRGNDLTVYGEGRQTRSFCYVDDLVEGFIKMMDSGDDIIGPINLGNPGEFTILQLAEMVKDLTGSAVSVAFNPLSTDDPKQRKPDISLAQDILKWRPKVSLQEGLVKTIAYFKKVTAEE